MSDPDILSSGMVDHMTEEPETFTKLTWGDLEEWAGAKTLARGRRYQQEGRVQDLARLPGGDLIAWVTGTRRYATTVSMDDESIESWCTCPVGNSCKHAVAIVLEYLESVRDDRPTPAAAGDDPRLRPLSMEEDAPPSLRSYLEGLTKDGLIRLLETLALHDPGVRAAIDDRRSIAREGAGPIFDALLSEIDAVTSEEPCYDHWSHSIPDYTRVQEKMNALLSAGHADEVVLAGQALLQKGAGRIEMIDDEGETADQIAACMDIVFSALAASSRPAHEKILYAIEAELEDTYDLCGGAWGVLAGDYPEEEWSTAADHLLKRLEETSLVEDYDNFITKYQRSRLVNMIAVALDKAGRWDEATVLQMEVVGRTDAYPDIVARLLREGRRDEALHWIARGISETEEAAPGIAGELWTILREMREKEASWPVVAAIRAETFFSEPTYPTFRDLEEAARRAGVYDGVRDAAMHYLITGERPPAGEGVLPDTGIGPRAPRWKITAPITDTLIEIAIAEGKPDEILHWYDRREEDAMDHRQRNDLEDRVADAVVDAYPERAIAIWKKKAERLIARVQVPAYEESLRYLRRLQSHMPPAEWEKYRGDLRRRHSKKRRFLEVLNRVEDRRIIEDI